MERSSLEPDSSSEAESVDNTEAAPATFAVRDIGPDQEDPGRPRVFSWRLDKTSIVIGLLVLFACAVIIFTLLSLLVAGSIGQERDGDLPPAAPSQRDAS